MLIVDMPMPKDCPQCPMAHWNKLDEFTGCEVAAGKLFAATRDKAYAESTSRPSWCPIKGELVRCKDCKHRKQPTDYCEKLLKAYVPDDFYCKYGERKENNDE